MMRSFLRIAAAVLLFQASFAQAQVSLKNGNFFVGFLDINYPGGFEPKIERFYNSKSTFKGVFGAGWGIEYEHYLVVEADGSVLVQEYGGGAMNRFSPVAFNSSELDAAVAKITAAAQSTGALGGASQVAAYRDRLKKDASFRNSEWEKLRLSGKIQSRQIPNGAQLVSNSLSYQYITKVPGGYVRTYDSGRVERFDENGRLVRIQDKNNNFIELTYGKDGHFNRIVDNFNRKIFLNYNQQGLVDKIQGENSKVCEYKYNPSGELIWAKDSEGTVNTYGYSTDGKHFLTNIGYPDKTYKQMVYYGVDKFEAIKSFRDRDGTTTFYNYDWANLAQGKYWVSVDIKDGQNKAISSSKYEYENRRKANGEEWTYKTVTTVDGDRTETVYNECCGLPVMIKRNGESTSFEYDPKGRLTKKDTPQEHTELKYDQKAGKVSEVRRYNKSSPKELIWSQFQYDAKGNLTYARNSEKKAVSLVYDTNGRIKSMIDQAKRQINFKYNENSKPIEITDPKLGSIVVTYKNSGEIAKVDSPSGRKVAVEVTTAFQNLLDIIRPAGVSLSF